MKSFSSVYHFLFNGYSCVCWAVNVLLNANVHVYAIMKNLHLDKSDLTYLAKR